MAYPLSEIEAAFYPVLLDILSDPTDEGTIRVVYHILARYLIGIKNDSDGWDSVHLSLSRASNLLSHFHVIDHPNAWQARLYWYQYAFSHTKNPYILPIDYEVRSGAILTQIANHPLVVMITDKDDFSSLDPDLFLR